MNSILEQQVNAAKGEVEALSCQQLEVQRQCELKSKEIENLNSQLQLANQKQYNTDKKLNIMEKHILQKENAAHQIQNELKITKERLQKAEAAVDLMIEKYKVHENAIGQNSRLEKELQKANNNYNLSLQKVKHLKVKLAKRSKSFKDLQSKWSGLTTYFRTLEEKSAKGELLSRSDFDAVLNYLMSSNLLNGDITEQDNYPSDESVKHLRTSSDKNSDLNSISKSSKDFVSKDAIEKVVRDFREVAITKKSNLGGIAELCITKEDEVLVVKQKHSEPGTYFIFLDFKYIIFNKWLNAKWMITAVCR